MDTKNELKKESVDILRKNIVEQPEWIKVHAAEFLLWTDLSEAVAYVFIQEEKNCTLCSPYRIGIWRVLAQVPSTVQEKKKWTDKILEAFIDESGPDRIHAAESLAKLRISPLKHYPEQTKKAIESPIKSLSLYTLWSTAFESKEDLQRVQKLFFKIAIDCNEELFARSIATYIIRKLGELDAELWNILVESALQEPRSSPLRIDLLSAAFVTMNNTLVYSAIRKQIYEELLSYKDSEDFSTRIKIADSLAERGSVDDIQILNKFLTDIDFLDINPVYEDVRSSAAFAIIKVLNRM